MEYFKRSKYQEKIIVTKYFNMWLEKNHQYVGKVDCQRFRRYWRYIRSEFFDKMVENPGGVDLPLFMGNMSIKIIDNSNPSTIRRKVDGVEKRIYYASATGRTGTVTWTKHKRFRGTVSLFGFEKAKTLKNTITKYLKVTGINRYQSIRKGIPKDSEEKEPSIFDLI